MTMLLIAGIAALAVGLLAIVLGIPVKEFSFGNTLILAGAASACTGLVLFGLAMVVRELQRIGRRLAASPAVDAAEAKLAPALPAGDQPAGAVARDRDGPAQPLPPARPRQDETGAQPEGMAEAGTASEPAPPKRRNLLFSSSRKERDRAPPPADVATVTRPSAPPIPSSPKEAAPPTFDEAWPQSDRARSDALRRNRTPSAFSEPNATPAAPAAPERPAPPTAPPRAPPSAPEEPAPVTVLKSGVVDGMAYSLYSDGSIEAQMPEGMMRFASIDELRSHLDHRP